MPVHLEVFEGLIQDVVVRIFVLGQGLGADAHGDGAAQMPAPLVECRVVVLVLAAHIVRSDQHQRASRVLGGTRISFQELARLLDGLAASFLPRFWQGFEGEFRELS